MSDLSDFFKVVSEEKKKQEDEFKSLVGEDIGKIVENIFSNPNKKIKSKKKVDKKIELEESIEHQVEDTIANFTTADIEQIPLDNYLKFLNTTTKNLKKQEITEQVENKELSNLKKLVYEIARDVKVQGGGGEVRLEFLDDVDRDSAKINNKFLKYNSTTEKWEGSNAGGAGPITYATTYVTSNSYTITKDDYYIGVNYAGAVTITLPSNISEGASYIVKDELGEASKGTNRYITILPSGSDLIDGKDRAILAFDFGSLTFVYRNGWRVV